MLNIFYTSLFMYVYDYIKHILRINMQVYYNIIYYSDRLWIHLCIFGWLTDMHATVVQFLLPTAIHINCTNKTKIMHHKDVHGDTQIRDQNMKKHVSKQGQDLHSDNLNGELQCPLCVLHCTGQKNAETRLKKHYKCKKM